VRAYENGASAVASLVDDIGTLVDEKRLTEFRGIGKALADKIAELYLTGRCEYLEQLRAGLPPGVLELSQVPEVGPKKAQQLHEALGISGIPALQAACEAGLVQTVKGFGAKTEQKILDGIRRYESRRERVLLLDALDAAEPLIAHVRACAAVERAELAGSLRRWRETVADLDVVAASRDVAATMDCFAAYPLVARVESRGDTKCTARLVSGLQVDLRVVPPEAFHTALHHFTGSKAHHVELRGLARERGLTISEWGLERIAPPARDGGGRPKLGDKLRVDSEAELYAHLGLPYIPPELREGAGEIDEAQAGGRFDDLVDVADIKGFVHCHTVYSDGKATVEQMARAADELGMQYLTITDHSPSAAYAGGVVLDDLKRQWDEIARVQEQVRVRLLRGTESDILETGALDYPDAILEQMEVVIASIHSRMKMDADQMTRRLVAAMRHPVFKIWGHALGRLIQRREPFACHVEQVLDAVAESRAAIEVNGDPHRLDLEARWIREARARGIRFVVSTDAHSVRQLGYLKFGVAMARRGGLRRHEVLNTLDAPGFAAAVRPGGGVPTGIAA
jgi:DNA polymerase (family 10)